MANWGNNPTLSQSYDTPTATTPTSGSRPAGWQQRRNRQLQAQYHSTADQRTEAAAGAAAPPPAARPTAAATQPATSASGVTPTGSPSPSTVAAAATAPGSPGPGWTQGADGGWLPPGHPAAGTVGAPPPTGAEPNPALYSPYGAYPGRPPGTVADTNPYTTETPYAAHPDLSGPEAAMLNSLQAALEGAPINKNVLRERNKESWLAQQDQQLQALAQNQASRGVSMGSDTQERAIREATTSGLLGANRETDFAADEADQNRRLTAAAAVNAALSDIQDRSSGRFRDDLSSATFGREGEVLENDRLRGDSTDLLNAYTTDLGAFFQNRSDMLAQLLGTEGLALDRERLGETRRQFNASYLLDLANFLEGNRRFGSSMNYNYAGLNAGLYNNYVARILEGL